MYERHGGAALAQEEGQAIADALGPHARVAILKNHGCVPSLGDVCNVLTLWPRLLSVGSTVDEAASLFHSFENACHSQLLAEAAAANGVPKTFVPDEAAKFTAQIAQSPVRADVPVKIASCALTKLDRTTSMSNSSPSLN